jgi:uncharacterized repeat protein (TIGR01451 family)
MSTGQGETFWVRLRRRGATASLIGMVVAVAGLTVPTAVDANEIGMRPTIQSAVTVAAATTVRKDPAIVVDDALMRQLASNKPTRFVIEFKEKADLSAAYAMTGRSQWVARGRYVFEQLDRVASRSQANVRAHLASSGRKFHPYWITNVIVVEDGDQTTVQNLLTFREISALRVYRPFEIIWPQPARQQPGITAVGSNIAWVGADQVWASGYTGSGLTVASIDTGVRYTHEALVGRYRGNLGGGSFSHDYNWFDPYAGTTAPVDSNDHGSHVTGTMVGSDASETNQIGVAPGANWIACQGFNPSATDAGLLACGQFMVAPTRTDGSDPDPDRRPHVVNNSWGDCGQTYDNWYEGVVDAWIAAGIVPVFANGNASNCSYSSPPGLNTVGNPARSKKVLGIGSTGNANGNYANHSNWGPTDDSTVLTPGVHPDLMGFGQIKPNIAAPGVAVRSATRGSDTSYANFSGTSMSAPHVAGLIALIWQAAPCLVGDYATTGTILSQTARAIDYNSGGSPAPGPGNVPNYATGWGEIDAVDAVDAAIAECGPQGVIAGQVTEAGSGTPIASARVEIEDNVNSRTLVVMTDASGQYQRTVPEMLAVGHDVSVSRYGYLGDSSAGVLVTVEQTTTVDFQLALAPSHTVSGTVTDAVTGWPLAAQIDISGYPDSPVWSDPVTGAYSVELVGGSDYSLTASSVIPGYGTDGDDLLNLSGNETLNFQLGANQLTCAAPGYAATPVSRANFESDNGGYTSSGTNNAWAWGTPVSWPSACAQGSGCWGTNLTGNYPNSANMALLSPVIDLSALAPGTTLTARWQQAHHIESASWDQALAEVSINGGAFATMWAHSGGTVQTGWTERSFDLTAAAGNTAQFRWRLVTDSSVSYSGLYVDDVRIVTVGCPVPTGDLLIGTVRDANTSTPLNGASVSVDGGTAASSFSANHPELGDGFFAVNAPTAAATVTGDGSPVHAGYGVDTAGLAVVGGATQSIDLDIPAGRLAFTPEAGPSATIGLGGISQQTLGITNEGARAAEFTLLGIGIDQHFETGMPPVGWSVTNNGGTAGCVWQLNSATGVPNYAGGSGLAAAADSDDCGSGSTMDTSLITPRIDMSTLSSAGVSFMLSYYHFGSSRFDVDVSLNDGGSWTNVYTRNSSSSAQGPGTPVTIDLGAHVGSSQSRLRFRYVAPGWNWWAMVDQIQVYGDFGLIPWLALAPSSGALAPTAVQNLNAVFDGASFNQAGSVTAPILVLHDTPYSIAPLTASLTVETPASFGTLSGSVASMGRCDANPAPLSGATVLIQGQTASVQTTTNGSGQFNWQLDSAEAPFSITAIAPGHQTGQASGISLTAGGSASADLDLRAELPCLDIAPGSLASTLQQGGVDSRGLLLQNSGAGALSSWSAFIGGEPGFPIDLMASQTASQTPAAGNTVSCSAGGLHAENYYLRLYDHAEFGLAGTAPVAHIEFAVETATAGSGGEQPVEVRLYRLDGSLVFANMTLLASKQVMLPDQTLSWVSVELNPPVEVAPGERVVAVLYLPNGQDDGHSLFVGSNAGGQTAPSYIAASACGIAEPASLASIGFPTVHVILNLWVQGEGSSCGNMTPVGWMEVDPGSGSLAAGASGPVDALFDASGLALGPHQASVCILSSDTGAGVFEIPVDLEVVQFVPEADLRITVSDSADPVQAGDPLSYTVEVENLGPGSTSSVQVLVQLPAGMSYIGNSAGTACIETATTLDCEFTDTLAASESFDFTVDMLAGVPGVQEFVASVSSADSFDPVAGNNSSTEQTTVQPAPSADLALSVNGPAVAVVGGSSASYLVKVANLGGDPVTGITVSLGWPAEFAFGSFTGTGWACTAGASSATCTLGGAHGSGFVADLRVEFDVSIIATSGTKTLTFAVAADQADGNPGNNAVSIDTEVEAADRGVEIFSDGFEG